MRKSNKQDLVYNLSAIKYRFTTVCETALGQLDHYFSTVGNGIDYDPKRGLKDEDSVTRKKYFIAEKHEFDLTEVSAERQKKCDDLNKEYQRMKDIFGDKVPSEMAELFNSQLAELEKPFEVMDELYYFSYIRMAREMVDMVRKEGLADPHSRLHIRTPYPLSENYSIISGMTRNDNPLMVELALQMSKAWVEVLQYYIESEWYYTDEEVQKYGAASYYYSLTYINKCIEQHKRIIVNLELENV